MMNNLVLKLLLAILIFDFSLIYAQDNIRSAFSLENIDQNVNVNDGSGILNYTLPLHDIKLDNLTIPVTLHYSAAGLKTDSKASMIGLGWNSLMIGEVNRELNGFPDDLKIDNGNHYKFKNHLGYLHHNPEVYFRDFSPNGYETLWNSENFTDISTTKWLFDVPEEYENFYNKQIDFAPDVFHVNTSFGLTGSFIIKTNGILLPNDTLTNFVIDLHKSFKEIKVITDETAQIKEFIIYSFNGLIIKFGKRVKTTHTDLLGQQPVLEYFATWYLTAIKTINDNIIFITYHDISEPLIYINEAQSFSINSVINYSPSFQKLKIEKRIAYPKKITYKTGKIKFFYDERLDLPNHLALKTLKIYDYDLSTKEIEFNFSYFGVLLGELDTRKLRLDSIKLKEWPGSDFQNRISFNYNNISFPETTYRKDWWGYYNKGYNNSFYNMLGRPLPARNLLTEDLPTRKMLQKFESKAERESDFINAQAGILKEISFSNGFSQKFIYEPHDYSFVGDTLNKITHQHETVLDFQASKIQCPTSSSWCWNTIINIPSNIIEKPQWVKITYYKNSCTNNEGRFIMDQKNYSNSSDYSVLTSTEPKWFFLIPGKSYSFATSVGNYCLANTNGTAPLIQVQFKTHDENNSDSFRKAAGGLRIKSIISCDNTGNYYTKTFKYNLLNSNNLLSSGIIGAEVNEFYYSSHVWHNNSIHPIYTYNTSNNQAGFLRSNSVYYLNIQENRCKSDVHGNCVSESFNEKYGNTIRRFKYLKIDDRATSFPFLPLRENITRRFLLDQEISINKDGNIIRVKKYEYSFIEDSISAVGFFFSPSQTEKQDGTFIVTYNRFYRYFIYPEQTNLININITNYNQTSQILSGHEFKYTSNNLNISLPESVVEKTTDGTLVGVEKSYSGSFDFSNLYINPLDTITLAMKNLVSDGRLTEPIEEIHYLQKSEISEKIAQKRIRYFYKTLPTGKVVLSKLVVKNFFEPTTYISLSEFNGSTFPQTIDDDEEVQTFLDYNDDYIPQRIVSNKGSTISRLYDKSNRILAEVKSIGKGIVKYTSFEDDFFGGWQSKPQNIQQVGENEFTITGNKYYNLLGESGRLNSGAPLPHGKYILSYWAKGDINVFLSNNGNILESSSYKEGEWAYHEKIVEWQNSDEDNFVTIESVNFAEAFIDELRLHEIDATMKTMGYYPDGKLMYESSASGNVVNYEYDSKNRLEWVLDRKRNVIEHHQYEEKDIEDPNSFHKHTVYTSMVDDRTKENIITSNSEKVSKHVELSDGFGRFRQGISYDVSYWNKRDQISFAEYDDFGRNLKKHLPYFDNLPNGSDEYIPDVLIQQQNYYLNQNDPNEENTAPYVETILEKSPLQRPVETGGIGEELQPGNGHSTQIEYGWNTAQDNIRKWVYSHASDCASAPAIYDDNELQKKTIIDPDGKRISTFTDARGREVAIAVEAKVRLDAEGRAYTGAGVGTSNLIDKKLTSYIVYDDFNRPVFEIPVKAMEELALLGDFFVCGSTNTHPNTEDIVNELVTCYNYDDHGRIWEKKMPGNGRQNFVYDYYDRPIMSRDEQQIEDGKWKFVKYDTRGRVILKGAGIISGDYAAHQDAAENHPNHKVVKGESFIGTQAGNQTGYSNTTYPILITDNQITNVYYFDNYGFSFPTDFNFIPFDTITVACNVTRGLATGSKTRILLADGTYGNWLTTVSYYDVKKRPIQAFTQNHLGGWDQIDTYYNEYGQIEKTIQYHRYKNNSPVQTISTRYEYYKRSGSLKNVYCKVNDDPEVIISHRNYDEKGRLKQLKLHKQPQAANNYLQTLDYRYNAQGNLTHINNTALIIDAFNDDDDDVFGQEITYFNESPEYFMPEGIPSVDDPHKPTPQYGGNISSMMWNAKTPDEDGTLLSRHAYVYSYDDLGNLTRALYGADSPAMPGEFNRDKDYYNEEIGYDTGGNMVRLKRNRQATPQSYPNPIIMDDIQYTYQNNGYMPVKINDAGEQEHSPQRKHFIDGTNQNIEYIYDKTGRLLQDKNRNITFAYNILGLPRQVKYLGSSYGISYTYDAAGNKLQKHLNADHVCPPNEVCSIPDPYVIDYIANFVYERGELKMIYHPEGVIRPTPPNAENETEFIYDYFIKDYLGNVRVVLTEEDATYTEKFLATLEEVYRQIENENFDNLDETASELPTGYPINGSAQLNERIAMLSAANGTEIGPAMVLPVRRGDKVSLSTEYFYSEDAPGTSYDHLRTFVNEILIALAASGSGVLRLNESQLIELATGGNHYSMAINDFLSSTIDTTDMSRPHAYLVWMLYDNNMRLVPHGSGAKRVNHPNELRTLLQDDIPIVENGYLYAYVSNGSAKGVSFDNFLVTYAQGKTRQINHYYPYGLTIAGINGDYDTYLNKYTSKELQTGEFDPMVSTGLEMLDFGSRFYDPQLGRWFTPDPAEQFHNPYLAMGNNPVMYVDPDGEFAWFVPVIIGAVVGAYTGGAIAAGDGGLNGANWNPFGGQQGSWQDTDWWKGAIAGGLIGATAGSLFSAAFAPTALGSTGFQATGMMAAGKATVGWGLTTSALQGASINMGISAISGGGWDEAYKSGLVGAASGLFSASGGFGMAEAWGSSNKIAQMAGKLGYQAIGTAGSSIGQNWVNGDDPFSKVTVGVGPVNLTLGKGQKLLQAGNNIGNIAFNAVGLTNAIAGGNIGFDGKNLTPVYSGGFIDKVYSRMYIGATGAHAVFSQNNPSSSLLRHEFNHIWHSRSLGDRFIPNYLFQSIYPFLMGTDQYYGNYFERIGEYGF